MIQNETKEELIERVYSLRVQVMELEERNAKIWGVIDRINDSVSPDFSGWLGAFVAFFLSPFRLKRLLKNEGLYILNHKKTFNVMNEHKVLDILKKVGEYETNSIDVKEYHNYAVEILGVKSQCENCSKNIVQRLHDTLQRRTFRIIEEKYPELSMKVGFTSGVYGGDLYKRVCTYCFTEMYELRAKMGSELQRQKSMGRASIAEDIAKDIDRLEAYIQARKNGEHSFDYSPEGEQEEEEETVGQPEGEDDENAEAIAEAEVEQPKEAVVEAEQEVEQPKEEEEESEVEQPEGEDASAKKLSKEEIIAEAKLMKSNGVPMKEIAAKLKTPYQTLYNWLKRAK